MLAFAFSSTLLHRPLTNLPEDPSTGSGEPRLVPELEAEVAFERAVKEVIRTQVLAGEDRIEHAAGAIGMSARSLQRRLSEGGVSFQELLEQARMETAKVLLIETPSPLEDVAAQLGYRHASHSSRAFRRTCGMTPREYRAMHQP